MCCRKNHRTLQARQMASFNPAMSTGVVPFAGNHHTSGVAALISAVGNLAIQPRNTTPPQYETIQTAYPVDDKKSLLTDAPPSYERATGEHIPEVATREMTNSTYNTMTTTTATMYDQSPTTQKIQLPPQFQTTTSPRMSELIEALGAALAAYRSGSGRHRHVRSAQRALRYELYVAEVERRRAVNGWVRCGECTQIWREIKAIDFGV